MLNKYHDEEWGVPVHDERKLFEFMVLDGMQAGLSWLTILRKREAFRQAFDDFDLEKVARYDDAKVEELLQNKGIVRNRSKIEAAITNARCILKMRQEGKSFDEFIWSFVGGKTINNNPVSFKDIPAQSKESEAMSKGLRERGFKFVGPTICYAFMQAAGMVNDHLTMCFRHKELKKRRT
ncbi:MAG: 3-methyl-adenine DNA glycosylase I [Methanomassiliicoccales archaeon PtaU1.Bin124]|nr:MAG: 3-methyl-adenine DNA glycosylase I [Methanomassiliicoccales archaeon PtaU1.Bin124]